MSDIVVVITEAGRAALVNAANTGTAPAIVAACGLSAAALAPDATTAELPGEIKRIATLSGDVVADDTIHLIVRDESADAYAVRSLALYLDDGTLFAVYGQAAAIMEKSAQAMLLLAVDVQFADIDAAALTFGDANFLNPPATTEAQGVVELATEAESAAGTDAVRAVTPKGLKAAVTSWLDARLGAGAPSVWVKSILGAANAAALRLALALDKVNNTADADKPVSTAQQTALDAKADKARTIVAGSGLIGGGTLEANRTVGMGTPGTIGPGTQNAVSATSHTHALSLAKGDIGLGNVDNTSDANKPVSNAQQQALNGKVPITSAARPGVTRLYRRDDNSNFSVQTGWDGARWFLRGYAGDDFHAECRVAYADAVNWSGIANRPTDLSAFANGPGYITADGRAYPRRIGGGELNFNWSGQPGQPSWLWGGEDGTNMYVYNPANFSVAYAANAGNADTLDGYHVDSLMRILTASIGQSGYLVFANGFKIVWGAVTVYKDSYSYVTYPVSFATRAPVVFPTVDVIENDAKENTILSAYSATGFTVYQANNLTNASLPFIAMGN